MFKKETDISKIRADASAALKKAALNEDAKAYLLNNPLLFKLILKAARRYIGGETLEQALATKTRLEANGFLTSLEFMGESVATVQEANEATDEFLRIIAALKAEKGSQRVSLDLSHLGLFLNHDLGMENFRKLAKASQNTPIDLFISAEGLDRTEDILKAYFIFSNEFSNVNITLQAYLHRTQNDLMQVLQKSRGKVRVVKGAYDGPKEQFLSRGEELNERYMELVVTTLKANRFCSIATHDPDLLTRLLPILKPYHQSQYEFEMLLGIGTQQLAALKEQGYPCRQYIVYGKEWYLYLCNRIAENPENLFSALVDIMS